MGIQASCRLTQIAMNGRHSELETQASSSADVIRKFASQKTPILIVSHFDADGISAGSILLTAVSRLGTPVHLRAVDNLSDKVLKDLETVDSDLVMFADIGSGYLSMIGKTLSHKQVIISDHHQTAGDPPPNVHHFNTHLLGFNGSAEISGAGTAYLLAKAVDQRNKDLSPMALVGCLGDQQDKGPRRTLTGLNETILKDAVDMKLVEVAQDLTLFGRQTRPVHRAIAATTTPFLPGLSGEEDRCLALLDAAGIPTKVDDRWRTVVDLSIDEKRRLVDRIIQHMISLKTSGEVALELLGSVYTLTREDPWTPLRDAREFASLLNACGRLGKAGLGVCLGVGDRAAAFEEAQQVYSEYRKWLAKYMNWLTGDPSVLKKTGNVVIVRGEGVIDENMTGAVSSLVSSSNLFGASKVTVVVTSTKDGAAKISARATDKLVARGVNLGRLLQELAPNYGGNGGGHAIAAGATLEKGRLEMFLEEFGKRIDSAVS